LTLNNPPRKRDYPLWWLLLGISKLPFPVLYLLADFFFLILYRLAGYRKKVVAQNLANSFPEKSFTERKQIEVLFYRNLCDVIVETIKLASIKPADLKTHARFINMEAVEEYIRKGTPVIILGSHLANWEWALPGGAVSFDFKMDGIYKPLSSPFFDWFMLRIRSRTGAHLVKMQDTLRDFIKQKQVPRAISMLSDQTPPGGEIQYWTNFLNQDTPFYVGSDKLATSFKYPVFFFGTKRLSRGIYEFELVPLITNISDLPQAGYPVTEQYARLLERWIRENPADYLWSHKRWKHKRPVTENVPVSS
jgi:KDO2-lipid IV(A) lauroyltransferase